MIAYGCDRVRIIHADVGLRKMAVNERLRSIIDHLGTRAIPLADRSGWGVANCETCYAAQLVDGPRHRPARALLTPTARRVSRGASVIGGPLGCLLPRE